MSLVSFYDWPPATEQKISEKGTLFNHINNIIVWLIDWLIRLIDKLFDWLIAWLIVRLVDCLIDWLIDWLIYRLIDWLIDWFSLACFGFRMIVRNTLSSNIKIGSAKICGPRKKWWLNWTRWLNFSDFFVPKGKFFISKCDGKQSRILLPVALKLFFH